MKKILFLYTGGREKRISEPLEAYAKEFFYGFHELKKIGYDVDFVERIIPENYKPRNPRYKWLSLHNSWAGKTLIMGNNAPFYLPHLKKIKEADLIIAIGDSIALSPEYYKLRGWIKGKIIHVSMGMANYWDIALKKGKINFFVKWYYNRLLNYADSIITLGEAETKELAHYFPKQAKKIKFIPFGVDSEFWSPDNQIEKKIDVLFIGNDERRDYKLLTQIPLKLPHLKFTFVSKNLRKEDLPKNVTIHNGSWIDTGLTDIEIRQLYRQAKIVINPIIETLQPSGQSVTLQAMSCGCPVIMSKFTGFWEPEVYSKESICIVEHSLESWQVAIQNLVNDPEQLEKLSKNGLELTNKLFSSDKMISRYLEVIHKLEI